MFEKTRNFIVALLSGHTVEVNVGLKPVVTEDGNPNAAVASAAVAAVASLNTAQAKAKLVELLSNPKYRFRSIGKLSQAIGADRWKTEELLAELGARPSRRNPKLFGLVSVVGNRQRA